MSTQTNQLSPTALDTLCIDTIRTLSMDAVQAAKSGHPGTPMALAPVAYTLWQRELRYDPADPHWAGRDRFVLSVGHASMLIYSLIHLAGVADSGAHTQPGSPALTLDDLRAFRQIDSRTPGHPEYGHTGGVETTTGPLGQGCGNSVGMAMAQRHLAARYNRPGFELFSGRVWVLAGDGDMQEGVTAEAASIAGHLKLGNLIWIYDSNDITIEGGTHLSFSEDVGARFEALGWHVQHVADANDTVALAAAYAEAAGVTDRPSFIVVKSVIGYGAPNKAGSHGAHGEPLGEAEIRGAKAAYGWPEDESFLVPSDVPAHFQAGIGVRGAAASAAWRERFAAYEHAYPELAAELTLIQARALPAGWDAEIPVFPADAKGLATRASSGQVLQAVGRAIPWMIGGSADLTPSTISNLKFPEAGGSFLADNPGGRNIHFGIREHAMGAICNGLALSGLRGYCAGFLIFSDYMKPPIRLAAIMGLPVVYIFTHDSIGVGEDGPTHQPIEQLATLRATPNLLVLRPGDANEVAECWRLAMTQTSRPSALILSRQPLPTLDRTRFAPAAGVARGGYVLSDCEKPELILMATGSELSLVVAAAEVLSAEGVGVRVVSLPSWEIFAEQDRAYRDSVLPPGIRARVAVEQAAVMGWHRFVGLDGAVVGMEGFGASAPLPALLQKFGFTVDRVATVAREVLGRV